jgi:hypothetical protein
MNMTDMIDRVFHVAGGQLPLFLEFLTQAAHSPVFGQATVVPIRRYVGFFADMVSDGIAASDLRPADPDVMSRVLIAFAMGLLTMGLLDPFGANWGDVARTGMRTFLAGLQPQGQPA